MSRETGVISFYVWTFTLLVVVWRWPRFLEPDLFAYIWIAPLVIWLAVRGMHNNDLNE